MIWKIFFSKTFWKNIYFKNILEKYFFQKYFGKIFFSKIFLKNIFFKNIFQKYFFGKNIFFEIFWKKGAGAGSSNPIGGRGSMKISSSLHLLKFQNFQKSSMLRFCWKRLSVKCVLKNVQKNDGYSSPNLVTNRSHRKKERKKERRKHTQAYP